MERRAMRMNSLGGAILRVSTILVLGAMFITATYVGLTAIRLGSISGLGAVGIQSGAEGPQVFVYGAQPPNTNTIYQLNDPAMGQFNAQGGSYYNTKTYWSWASGSAILGATVNQDIPGIETQASVTMNTPQQATQGYGGFNFLGAQTGGNINYFTAVSGPNGQKTHVYGQVMESNYVMDFKANGNPNVQFKAGAVWFHIKMNVWAVQMCDPSNSTTCQNGYVWAAPLEAVITTSQSIYCNDSNCGKTDTTQTPNNNQLNPMQQGASLSLYNGVTNSAPIGNPYQFSVDPSNIKQAYAAYISQGGSYQSPDPNIQQDVYYPVQFSNFGPFGCNFLLGFSTATCYPDDVLTVTVYYLVIGTFLWTNPNITSYNPNPQGPSGCSASNSGCGNPLVGLAAWLSNPFDLLALSLFGGIFLFIIVLGVVAIFAPGVFGFIIGKHRGQTDQGG